MYTNFDNKENNFRTRMWIAFIFVLGLVAAILECYFALCWHRAEFEYAILLPYRIFQHSRYNRIYTNNINLAME